MCTRGLLVGVWSVCEWCVGGVQEVCDRCVGGVHEGCVQGVR